MIIEEMITSELGVTTSQLFNCFICLPIHVPPAAATSYVAFTVMARYFQMRFNRDISYDLF